jgi:hypothetical protein
MIKYALQCENGHAFEGWFRNSDAFDAQSGSGDLACPRCGSAKVGKAVMAPRLGKGGRTERQTASEKAVTVSAAAPAQAKLREKLRELRRMVEANCEDVGTAFAEEARKIHYGEAEARGIYGEASREEAEALGEEGIAVAKLPWISRDDA